MNAQLGLDFVVAALKAAGMPAKGIRQGSDLSGPANRDSSPGASVYLLDSWLRRSSGRRERVPLSALKAAPPGALGGALHGVAEGITVVQVDIDLKDRAQLEAVMAAFIVALLSTPFTDARGVTYEIGTQGEERDRALNVVWSDDMPGLVRASLAVPIPTVLWRESARLPIAIELDYVLEGQHG